jgi:hypothetical protein
VANSGGTLCLHLYGHLNYHLGQLDHHRRMGVQGAQ